MEIKIPKLENSSITKEIELELGKYTIFAGENNSGKTNLMKALRGCLPEEQIIYIPAEIIQAEEQLKTGAQTDPMRDAFLKLIEVSLRELPNINYESVEAFLEKISKTFDTYNVKNIRLDLETKRLSKDDIKKIIRDEVSKKILKSAVKDTYGEGYGLTIKDVGQGTQRLIIAATLQEISKAKIEDDKELFLIFEEPEIYLHPKLKRSLYEALLKISEGNIRIILTTHDPYFIELGIGQKIYNVFRDNNGVTDVKPPIDGVLDNSSHAEINYVIFEVPSTDYFLQLYQKAEEKGISNFEDHEIDGVSLRVVRGALAHKTDSLGRKGEPQPSITEDIKKKSIDYLRGALKVG